GGRLVRQDRYRVALFGPYRAAQEDAAAVNAVRALGLDAHARPLWMTDPAHSADIVDAALALAGV
ncbi:MAG: hypothetical protein CMH33_01305, partial [Microbacterium sp.]|nr:hypothetical protein [Microbacterium sp.]